MTRQNSPLTMFQFLESSMVPGPHSENRHPGTIHKLQLERLSSNHSAWHFQMGFRRGNKFFVFNITCIYHPYITLIYIYICILILATSCNKGEVIRCLSIRGVLPLSPPRPSDILWSSARLRLGPKDPCHLCLGCWNHLQVHSTEVSSLAEIKDVD